jgi:putative ABC transport system ATP-binding protein
MSQMLRIHEVSHVYSKGKDIAFKALDNINATIQKGKFIILLGQSGSGKTTLLNVMAGLLRPSSGLVEYNGKDIYKLNDKEVSIFRRDNIGFVFQNYFLDSSFSALDNVKVPLFLHKDITAQQQLERAKSALAQVGLQDKINNKPTQLSGGQCQRVAIARALVNNPKFIIADEPTGNLDATSGDAIVQLLRTQVATERTVVMVTHNNRYVGECDIVYRLEDGQISS